MIETVHWIESVERLAADLYKKAAKMCGDDKPLAAFLGTLHEDELLHAEMMQRIAELISGDKAPTRCDIKLTPQTREEVEAPLHALAARLDAGNATRKELWEGMARIELSEWNEVFLYFVALFRERSPALQRFAAGMQTHIARIEHFLDGLPPDERPTLDVGALPKVWQNKYLVVEDNAVVREFIINILTRQGLAHAALNGQDGIELLRRHFFNVIITDIEMPVMNGIRFYKEAVAEDPRWKKRFLFMTFDLAPDREQFLNEEGITCLLKPFDPRELVDAVKRIAQTRDETM